MAEYVQSEARKKSTRRAAGQEWTERWRNGEKGNNALPSMWHERASGSVAIMSVGYVYKQKKKNSECYYRIHL